MTTRPKISIIVPVYNVQAYLGKCLKSLLSQTLKDIEIICINDGSTDDSLDILNFFAIQDKRIRIINQSNKGVSASRNAGLDVAKGKYVMFVDGDDWIEPETCAECYKKIIADKADMLVFNFCDVFSDTRKVPFKKLQQVDGKTFKFFNCPDEFFYAGTSIWGRLFKRKASIYFDEILKKGEDSVYFWEYCLKYNPKISILNKVFYNYLQRADSAMKSEDFVNDCEILNSIKILIGKECFKNAPMYIQSRILDRFASSICWEIDHTTTILKPDYFKKVQAFVDMFASYSGLDKFLYYSRLRDICIINNRKIDLVYLWVNGNDKEWIEQKNYWARKCGLEVNYESNQECRFIDNQELRYSLRSAELFVPWINRIYIITNGQIPEWLDASNPKIKIITHEQIMPRDGLPTFNSCAIEACLANIPDLSEYFLYANDDFFFAQSLSPAYFFDAEGKPVLQMIKHNWSSHVINNEIYQNGITYSKELIRKKMHKDFGNLACIHNIVPYRKSMFAACASRFAKEFDYAAHCRFREKNVVQRTIVSYYTMAKLKIDPKIINIHTKDKPAEAILINLTDAPQTLSRLQITQPKLFCINDNEKAKSVDREKLKNLLAMLFPMPAAWEKDFGINGSILLNMKLLPNSVKSATLKPTTAKPANRGWFLKKYVLGVLGIPFLKIRRDPNSCRVYLFKLIPLYKITYRKQKTVFKLFNFLPLFNVQKA